MASPRRIRIGISACLLGREVRYDGGHKRERLLLETLGRFVEWVPVCPEVELGLGTPRPTLRIERGAPGDPLRLVMPETGRDWTGPMRAYGRRRAGELGREGLSGYVFKSSSPSCGLRSVAVHSEGARPRRSARGLFAEALLTRFPHLPVEDEGRLRDPRIREGFVAQVRAFRRWQALEQEGVSLAGLLHFHRRHEPALLARSRAGARRLGRLLDAVEHSRPPAALAREYLQGFSAVMRRIPKSTRHRGRNGTG